MLPCSVPSHEADCADVRVVADEVHRVVLTMDHVHHSVRAALETEQNEYIMSSAMITKCLFVPNLPPSAAQQGPCTLWGLSRLADNCKNDQSGALQFQTFIM